MREETGLEVRVDSLLLDEPSPSDSIYQRWKTYRCAILAGEARPGSEPEDGQPTRLEYGESPQQLRDAVNRLREAVQRDAPEAHTLLASYERNANRIDPITDEFMRDLQDIEALTRWADAQGAARMTLEVNW